MLRGTLFGKSLGKCLKPGFNFGSGKHHFNLKRMFSAEGGDEEGGELEVIPDEQDDDGSKSRVRPLDYQFYGKNIAIVLENPLFPYNNKVVHLGKYHAKVGYEITHSY